MSLRSIIRDDDDNVNDDGITDLSDNRGLEEGQEGNTDCGIPPGQWSM